jgi:Holliday junction DNA helicase RuvA
MIRGTIAHLDLNAVVIDVGGVGYHVHVTVPTEQFVLGSVCCFHTYLAVRENALDLYGFLDRDTLDIFELLINLPKIGPRSAQQILTQADTALLRQAVQQGDASYLSKMSGIGKKSAEKIVAGLREKFENYDPALVPQGDSTDTEVSYARDTIDALVALGYPLDEARRAVRQLAERHPEITDSAAALKFALRQLSQ